MNIFEAGVISGMATGAAIGGIVCKSFSVLGIAGGVGVGLVAGGVAGWIYGAVVVVMLAVMDGIWRSARKLPQRSASEAEMRAMSRPAIRGVFWGAMAAFIFWLCFGWASALVAAAGMALLSTSIAVLRVKVP